MRMLKITCVGVCTGLFVASTYLALRSLPYLVSNTQYATNFDESKWKKIEIGQTKSDVVAAIGTPLLVRHETNTSSEWWHFTRQAEPTANYYFRALLFSKDGKVTKKESSYYSD